MKLKNIFLILYGIWMIDFFTTIIGVGILGYNELNPLAKSIYNLGGYGFLIFPLITFFLISIISLSIFWGERYASYLCKKKRKKDYSFLIPLITIIVFSILEGFCIINNLFVLFNNAS